MLQILISRLKVSNWNWEFFEEFNLITKFTSFVAPSTMMSILDQNGNELYACVIDANALSLSLIDPGQNVLAAMLVAVKRYEGKLILGDEMVTPQQAWLEIVPKSKEDPKFRSLLEKHGVLPVDVLAKLRRGSAVF
jgi:hypothetical protein